ncbi:MAG: hypothetical protein GC168_05840 [Candidatus Hydrogenedens sp.]|nr:hypothetical protein [Candidatus Hydrogenedens sp.]
MKKRLCAQCGAEIVPDELAGAPGVSACGECGAQRREVTEIAPAIVRPGAGPEAGGIPPEAEVFIRGMRGGRPFVFQQYTRTYSGGSPGCGCGCVVVILMIYLMLRGFFSLF